MARDPGFDVEAAHRFFSADCFNRAWEFMDRPARTAEEDEEMLRLSLASTWHWTQRPDCGHVNLSISYWQTSRIYSMLGQAENALRYARMSLSASQNEGVPPFYLGYAYEALARAAATTGDRAAAEGFIEQARLAATRITDDGDRDQLLEDLERI